MNLDVAETLYLSALAIILGIIAGALVMIGPV